MPKSSAPKKASSKAAASPKSKVISKTPAKNLKPTKPAGKAASKTEAKAKAPVAAATEKVSAKAPHAAPPPVEKKPRKGKAPKRVEQDEDLLAGEADGSDEVIEGLDEIDETEVEEVVEVEIEAEVESETEVSAESAVPDEEEIFLTDAEGRRLCRVRDCDQAAIVETYCRFHYLQNWKRIQVRRGILADGKLERYVEELTSRYPDKFLEMIRKDLRTEKDFLVSIAELEIDESSVDNEFEDESQNFIEEVRGVSENTISDEEEF